MSRRKGQTSGPQGGIQANERTRRWAWEHDQALVSRPVRCRRDDWYIARARLAVPGTRTRAVLLITFLCGDEVLSERVVPMWALPAHDPPVELVGWFETPETASHLRVRLTDAALRRDLAQLVLQDVSERDPKSHPLANVPRWGAYQPPFVPTRVILPRTLEGLAEHIGGRPVDVVDQPQSKAALQRLATEAVCVLNPDWVTGLRLTLRDVERLAAGSWLVMDLATLARLLRRGGHDGIKTRIHAAEHGLMSARNEYADVHTRGLALQDVVPFSVLDDQGGFRVQVLHANRAWKRYADEAGFATLLSCETPWEKKHGDVISAGRALAKGELVATDLPWMVAGCMGPVAAPSIAMHLLRMHLCEPVEELLQYWNRWEDDTVLVRDIGDLPRRYQPLQAVRWAAEPATAQLGISLPPPDGQPTRHLMLRTGRMDAAGVHDGLPAEPLMIYMKQLAREVREQTAWAREHLSGLRVTWQFAAHAGLKYAVNFESAAVLGDLPTDVVSLRLGPPRADHDEPRVGGVTIRMTADEGLLGDESLDLQRRLHARLAEVLAWARGAEGGGRIASSAG